jgi:hypothetical protein
MRCPFGAQQQADKGTGQDGISESRSKVAALLQQAFIQVLGAFRERSFQRKILFNFLLFADRFSGLCSPEKSFLLAKIAVPLK